MPVRIAILGGPRCGKTTLIQTIIRRFKNQRHKCRSCYRIQH